MLRNKRLAVLAGVAASLAVLSACSKNNTAEGETGYIEMSDLNSTVAVCMTAETYKQEDIAEDIKISKETGTITEKSVILDADVYNEPDDSASKIGSVKKDEIISVIGEYTGQKWAKVVYGGRVAFLQVSAIEEEKPNNVNTVAINTTNTNPTTPDNNTADNQDGNNDTGSNNDGGSNSSSNDNGGGNSGSNDNGGNNDSNQNVDNNTGDAPSPDGNTGNAPTPDGDGGTGDAPSPDGDGGTGDAPSPDGDGGTGDAPSPDGDGGTGDAPSPDGDGGTSDAPTPDDTPTTGGDTNDAPALE